MKKIVLGVSLALAAGSAFAEENNFDDRWYLTPSVSFVRADSDKNGGSAIAANVSIGKFIRENISLDFEMSHERFDVRGSDKLRQFNYGFIGRYHFTEKQGFLPYLGMGVGAMKHSSSFVNGTEGTLSALGGMSKEITDNIKLRTELRYRLENSDRKDTGHNTFGDFIFNAGLSIGLGEKAVQTTKTDLVERAPQLDGDNDGVSDVDDRCPNSPAGSVVDATGCAIVDGDDDNDGVANSKDACPNSRPGAVVGSDGCEVKVVIELQGVHFDTDKSTLKPVSIGILNAAVKTLGDHGTILVEVAGHTDSTASDDYNQALSQRRAKVVFDYLVDHGVAANRMTWKGYGESSPIATNDTEDGKAKNRRTELIVK
jgi:OOP family OmpA-OmpF porin